MNIKTVLRIRTRENNVGIVSFYLFEVRWRLSKGIVNLEDMISFLININQWLKRSNANNIQLTLVISNSMGPWQKFESTVVRLKRSYEITGSVVCLTTKRETTRAKFWRAKTSIACPYSRNDFKRILCFCCWFFLSVKVFESCGTTDNFFVCMNMFICFVCFSAVALSLNFTHHDVFFVVQYCLFTINCVFLLFNKV